MTMLDRAVVKPTDAGPRISLDFRHLNGWDAFRQLARSGGPNVELSVTVDAIAHVDLLVKDVPVREVFDALIWSNELAYEQFGSTTIVMSDVEFYDRHNRWFDYGLPASVRQSDIPERLDKLMWVEERPQQVSEMLRYFAKHVPFNFVLYRNVDPTQLSGQRGSCRDEFEALLRQGQLVSERRGSMYYITTQNEVAVREIHEASNALDPRHVSATPER